MLSSRPATPVLFLATVSAEAREGRLIEAAMLESLLERLPATRIDLDPLDDASYRELIEQLLPFTPATAEDLARRTSGNPLLAMELVNEWVESGVLTSSPDGFRIRPGSSPSVPAGVQQVWLEQLDRLLSDHPAWWPALEIAAVLGMEVDAAEWALACEAAGLDVDAEARDALLRGLYRKNLARASGRGFAFAQAHLRRLLVERAGETKQLRHLHSAAAAAAEQSGGGLPATAERHAFHLEQAGRGREAIGPLLSAARSLLDASDLIGARTVLDRRDSIMEAERVPPSAHEWGSGWLLRAEILFRMGRYQEADTCVARTLEQALRLGWPGIAAAAAKLQAKIDAASGG